MLIQDGTDMIYWHGEDQSEKYAIGRLWILDIAHKIAYAGVYWKVNGAKTTANYRYNHQHCKQVIG